MATTNGKAMAFREMHRSGCFVMANPWDRGSAVMFRHLGFKALATTSAGLAFTLALPDAVGAIPLEATLENIRQIVRATPLPVNADFQDGFSRLPEGVAQNVARCVETGVAGLSIEDATGDSDMPLYERELATERVRAARSATPLPVVLTARCEAWLVGHPDPLPTAIDRLVAYAEAGADCLYAPGVRAPDDIKAIVNAVAPKPVNVLVSTALPHSVSDLGVLGVRRISVGSALARTAWGAFMRAARSILEDGTFADFADAASFDEINRVFGAHPNEQASVSG